MLKRKLLVLVTIMVLVTIGQAFGGTKIVNGIDANFPPFAFIDKTGQPSGFDVEAMNWIAKEMGYEVTHKAFDWDGIVTSLVTKKIDLVASGMSITPARLEKVNFTVPYWRIEQVMVVKKASGLTVDDLLTGGKVVGVQQGTSEAKWLKAEAKKRGWNIKLRYYNSSPLAVEDVLNGRIAGAAMDDAPAKDAADKKAVKSIGTFGMHSEDFGYAVRKDDTQLLKDLNEGLKRLMASPYWQELAQKYGLK